MCIIGKEEEEEMHRCLYRLTG